MAAIDGNIHTSDEEWMISRAKTCLSDDQYASRAWLLTARTLFPRNLAIQVCTFAIDYDKSLTILNQIICGASPWCYKKRTSMDDYDKEMIILSPTDIA